MRRNLVLGLLSLGLAACGSQPSSPGDTGTGEAKGLLGKYFYVNVPTPQNGTVDSVDGKIHCVAGVYCAPVKYNWTDVVTLRATPNTGYALATWAGDCNGQTCVLSTVGHAADFTVVAVFNKSTLIGHGNYTRTADHAQAFFQFLANAPTAPKCNVCHGATYAGQGIAPSCNACHQAAGWANWQQSCSFCHGLKNATTMAGYDVAVHPEWAAPPDDIAFRLNGVTDGAAGAHQKHVNPAVANAVRGPIACAECHVVPATAIHTLNLALDIPFGPLSHSQGASPTWAPATLTCGTNYCHGSFSFNGIQGTNSSLPWTGTLTGCTTCHAMPPVGHTYGGTSNPSSCAACHPDTVLPSGAIDLVKGRHINGLADSDGACDACHGFPPATGAHLAHFSAAGAGSAYGDTQILEDKFPAATPASAPAGYAFGCGLCHGSDYAANHNKGSVNVVLSSTGAPAGTLLARNAATAAYDATAKTCSGVYCHSSGQEGAPTFVTTPGWTSGAALACDGCHGNPPRYPTGAAGSATANTHLLLRVPIAGGATHLYGHFTWHNFYAFATTEAIGKHGVAGEGAAPMSCQTCHADTVNPADTGRSGFYWLNTTGEYNLPGASLTYGCRTSGCHSGAPGAAAQGNGGVLPLRHVNGVRDVAFDKRTAAPSYSGLPAAPYTPDFPYWARVLSFKDAAVLPPGATWNPPPPPTVASSGTVSFRLDGVGYDPATKTCSSVACHLRQSTIQWGGTPVGTSSTCFSCHTNH